MQTHSEESEGVFGILLNTALEELMANIFPNVSASTQEADCALFVYYLVYK